MSFTKDIPQKSPALRNLARTNTSEMIVNGMETAPTKTPATAMLANRMFELMFFKSPLLLTAMITKMFRRMVTGQIMIVTAAVILNKVVSLKTHVCIGGQNNSGGTKVEVSVVKSVSLKFILMSYHLAQETRKDRLAAFKYSL